MRPARRLAIVALAAGLGAACAAALRHGTPRDAVLLAPRWPGTTVEDLERGRRTYVRRCSGCHTLILPAAHSPEEWPRLVDAMAKKARLRPEEREDVVRFLVAVASDDARLPGR
ncbi:MAG TPA: cytochrome c [Vicinamibacteria bacterium]|nr:cytochrome c [Vicinamibacteria bacterium]